VNTAAPKGRVAFPIGRERADRVIDIGLRGCVVTASHDCCEVLSRNNRIAGRHGCQACGATYSSSNRGPRHRRRRRRTHALRLHHGVHCVEFLPGQGCPRLPYYR